MDVRPSVLLLLLLSVPACRTRTEAIEPGVHPLHRRLELRVMQGSRQVGKVVLMEIEAEEAPVRYYQFERTGGARVGYCDMDGRFFKYRLFADEPSDIGLHSFKEGMRRLYEIEGPLVVLPLKGKGMPTEAAARKLLVEMRGTVR